MNRRSFLRSSAALAAMLAARPLSAIARTPLGAPGRTGAARASRLAPNSGLFLVHTDLHNHSLVSGDAFGKAVGASLDDPAGAYAQMRAGGLDVACLTEHAISGKGHGEYTCPGHQEGGCHKVEGINDTDWAYMEQLADAADDHWDDFITFRAFEWSTPTVGHLNVWFSERYTDAVRQHAFFTPRAASELDQLDPRFKPIADLFDDAPDIATMRFFWEWLARDPDDPLLEGGNDGIACFNHPNEFGNFEDFRYAPAAAPNVVSFEALNGDRDFFWWRAGALPNPFNACLNAGWRVGFTGVSDEHSPTYARPGMARGGLWVSTFDRDGVKAALQSRRSFATFEPGLRLEATANGVPMGQAFAHDDGPIVIEIDADAGPERAGTELVAQVVRPGADGPARATFRSFTLGTPVQIEVPVARDEGDWLFVRICDPARPQPENASGSFADHGGAYAYASPWFLDPVT